jgi:hypothetical protein
VADWRSRARGRELASRVAGIFPRVVTVLAVALASGALASLSVDRATAATSGPIAVVVRSGGLCPSGRRCRTVFRITDTAIKADGYVSRPLRRAARAELLRAIDSLDLAELRAHPFKGTCPTAYDGGESVYSFRGFHHRIASCTYDLRHVRAVAVADRLLAQLKRR